MTKQTAEHQNLTIKNDRLASDNSKDTNESASSKLSVVEKTKLTLSIISVVAGIVGLAWGFVEYQKRVETARINESFKLVELWESRNYRTSFASLDLAFSKYYSQLSPEIVTQLKNMDQETRIFAAGNLGKNLLDSMSDDIALKSAVQNMIYFFTRAEICIEENICSSDVVQAFFERTVLSLWANLNGFILAKRSQYHGDYGVKFEQLARRFSSVKNF